MNKSLVLILIVVLSSVHVFANPLTIEEVDLSSVIITLDPQEWIVTEKRVADDRFVDISFAGGEILTNPGEPRIPGCSVLIGIPEGDDPEVQIISIVTGRTISGKVIPTPTYLPDIAFIPDPDLYSKVQRHPADIVMNKRIGYICDQRVMLMQLFPAYYLPKDENIVLYNRIVIRVNFQGTRGYVIDQFKEAIDESEQFYQGSLANYHQAKYFREIRSVRELQKPRAGMAMEFYKLFIKSEGIYKVTGKMLADNGIDISSIDLTRLRIYNNGGRELSRSVTTDRPDSLILNAFYVEDGGDGRFDVADYLLFYGVGVNGWDYDPQSGTYSHYINHYGHENIYWLSWSAGESGKRMSRVISNLNTLVPTMTTFRDHVYLEDEFYNPINSGIDWYGKMFGRVANSIVDDKKFSFNLPGAVAHDTANVKIRVVSASAGDQRFEFYMNENYLGQSSFYSYSFKYMNLIPYSFTTYRTHILKDGLNELKIRYYATNSYSKAYLDWIEIDFERQLKAVDNRLLFYSPAILGSYTYELQGFSDRNVYIFDITHLADVRIIENYQLINDRIVFTDDVSADTPRRYFVTTSDNFMSPLRIVKDIPSNLRSLTNGADFIIITHNDFYDQALPLKSLRENCDNLKTEVVNISDVYDEFSWGLFDPVAIRDFVKCAYDSWTPRPRYVLLFGSGDFDYRNIIDPGDHNFIPPFETTELYEGDSRVRDDFYACVRGEDDFIDLAIGRLPVRNPDQADHVVRKIIDYTNNPLTGDWRNRITFVADDVHGESNFGFEREHTDQAEFLAENQIPPGFEVQKIYLLEYPAVYTASITGVRKPAAQEDIIRSINQGTLIINYIGHGRYDLWAHEVVLEMSTDLQRIACGRRQAFWVAGTCYFGRFDNPYYESMSEELMLLKENGAIAVFAAARLVGSGPNADLNKILYSKLLPSAHFKIRLGDAVTQAKNARGNLENDQKILLFGDPTMYLGNPQYDAKILDIEPDSIRALTKMKIRGEIQRDGMRWDDYSGTVLLEAFDSRKYRTYSLEDKNVINYWLPGNAIFRGKGSVVQGEFEVEFIVPKDITYGSKTGRVNVYFFDDEDKDGSGFQDNLAIGGTNTDLFDTIGPEIRLRCNGSDLQDSGFTPPDPILHIELEDSLSGVNIAGDIGHTISLTLDGKKEDVTSLFEYYNDSYVTGNIEIPIGPLEEGLHQLTVKAWDNSNNSSELSIQFNVVSNDRLVLRDVLNYPNPFQNATDFTFWVNQACAVEIKIYTVAGRLIKRIEQPYVDIGFNYIRWDGRDEDGDELANGVYLYKIKAASSIGEKDMSTDAFQKLMIFR